MAENELQTLKPKIDFKAAEISIANIDDIQNYVDGVVEKYVNVLITKETKSDATDARKQLKDTQNELHDARMKIQEMLNESYTPIETKLKQMEDKAKDAWRKVQDQIAELDKIAAKEEADKREKAIKGYIIDKNKDYDIDVKRITWAANWLKKQTYKTIFAEIDEQFELIVKADRALEVEKQSITQIAKALNIEPDAYIAMVGSHEFTEIQALMDKAVETRNKRIAAEAAEHAKKVAEKHEDVAEAKPKDVQTEKPVENKNVNTGNQSDSYKIKKLVVYVDKGKYERLLRFMQLEDIKHKFEDYTEKG